jgi:hypothetical protein
MRSPKTNGLVTFPKAYYEYNQTTIARMKWSTSNTFDIKMGRSKSK